MKKNTSVEVALQLLYKNAGREEDAAGEIGNETMRHYYLGVCRGLEEAIILIQRQSK